MRKGLVALWLAMAVLPFTSAVAQTANLPPKNALDLTCGDMMRALRIADPGKNPTAERQRAAIEAQDDIAGGLYWIHGYRTGTMGSNVPALTPDWMGKELKSLVASCKASSPNGNATLLQMVRK